MVLILILLEDGRRRFTEDFCIDYEFGLNPYSVGRWSKTGKEVRHERGGRVLILILLEDGRRQFIATNNKT